MKILKIQRWQRNADEYQVFKHECQAGLPTLGIYPQITRIRGFENPLGTLGKFRGNLTENVLILYFS